eukprot:1179814-Prorocentrum_minimum.AAC.1
MLHFRYTHLLDVRAAVSLVAVEARLLRHQPDLVSYAALHHLHVRHLRHLRPPSVTTTLHHYPVVILRPLVLFLSLLPLPALWPLQTLELKVRGRPPDGVCVRSTEGSLSRSRATTRFIRCC